MIFVIWVLLLRPIKSELERENRLLHVLLSQKP